MQTKMTLITLTPTSLQKIQTLLNEDVVLKAIQKQYGCTIEFVEKIDALEITLSYVDENSKNNIYYSEERFSTRLIEDYLSYYLHAIVSF